MVVGYKRTSVVSRCAGLTALPCACAVVHHPTLSVAREGCEHLPNPTHSPVRWCPHTPTTHTPCRQSAKPPGAAGQVHAPIPWVLKPRSLEVRLLARSCANCWFLRTCPHLPTPTILCTRAQITSRGIQRMLHRRFSSSCADAARHGSWGVSAVPPGDAGHAARVLRGDGHLLCRAAGHQGPRDPHR